MIGLYWCGPVQYMPAMGPAFAALSLQRQPSKPRAYRLSQGVALITSEGPLLKQSYSDAPSSVALAAEIKQAADDKLVKAIFWRIDGTFGGESSGTRELSDAVAYAASKKPMHVYAIDGLLGSGYWAASRATTIAANEPALVGHIGEFVSLVDSSKAAEKQGLKIHVIRSNGADAKAAGHPGTEIAQSHIDDAQRIVDHRAALQLADIRAGRKMTEAEVKSIADGRVWPAAEALKLRLIDRVCTEDEAWANAVRAAAGAGASQMNVAQVIAAMTSPAIHNSTVSKDQIDPCLAENTATSKEPEMASFQELVKAEMAKGFDKKKAIARVVARDPQAHAEYIEQFNSAAHSEAEKQKDFSACRDKARNGDDSKNEYWQKVSEIQQTKRVSRGEAMREVNRKHPKLRESLHG